MSKLWDKTSISGLIRALKRKSILRDAASLGDYFWRYVSNPSIFVRELEGREILELVNKSYRRNSSGPTGIRITAEESPLS
ncbi:MAG: hypothetical protein Q8Q03_00250, partial [bacterium]|nr:hypothetical protein [bacterium]